MTIFHDTARLSRGAEATGGDGSRGSAVDAAARSKRRKRKKSRPPPPSSMEAAAQSKPTKRKKKAASSSAAAAGLATPSPPSGGDGNGTGDGQQQQLAAGDGRGKQRVVWTEELHDMFLKAYNILGEDAVPKKILALMNVDEITRENVASHLQKYRLSLKQEEKRIPDKGDERATLHSEASSSQTPLPATPSPHPPPAQAQEPAPSSSLHPLPPQQAPFASVNMSQLQIGHGQELLQTPPDCFDINTTATDLLLHPGFPMAQPIQQRFTPPPEATVATRRKLFKKQQEAGRDATTWQAAAAASGYSAVLVGRDNAEQTLARAPASAPSCARKSRPGPHMQASQALSTTGEQSVPEPNMRYEEAEIPIAQLGMVAEAEDGHQGQAGAGVAAKAEDGQGAPAEPEAAEMAAGPEEEHGRAGEPGAAAPAGSASPPGSSIHGQYWKIDDAEVSWDFGFLWYPTAAVTRNKP